jgi:hypothetical protein
MLVGKHLLVPRAQITVLALAMPWRAWEKPLPKNPIMRASDMMVQVRPPAARPVAVGIGAIKAQQQHSVVVHGLVLEFDTQGIIIGDNVRVFELCVFFALILGKYDPFRLCLLGD